MYYFCPRKTPLFIQAEQPKARPSRTFFSPERSQLLEDKGTGVHKKNSQIMTQLLVQQQLCKLLPQRSCINLSKAALKLSCKKSCVKDYKVPPLYSRAAQSLRPFLSYAAAMAKPSFAVLEPDLICKFDINPA